MKNKLVVLIISLINCYTVIGQDNATLQFDWLTSEHKLSQNFITCIFQDSSGYIWIGTFDGLNRYDGHKFETFYHNPTDSFSIPGNTINTIYQDKNGRLWIGTSSGLCYYNSKENNFINFKSIVDGTAQLRHDEIRAIYLDEDDLLWIGTYGGGIDRVDLKNNEIKNFFTNPDVPGFLLSEKINCFYNDSEGNFWIGTEGGGISLFNKETQSFKSFHTTISTSYALVWGVINCIKEDEINSDILWIGTWNNGLIKFNNKTESINIYVHETGNPKSINNNTVRSIEQDLSGNLWLSTFGGGICLFNTKTEEFLAYTNDPYDKSSLSYNLVWSSLIDKSGVLWLGTFGGGLNKCIIKNHQIIHLKASRDNINSLNNNSISAILTDHKGLLWIGTVGGGINVYNAENKSFEYYLNDIEPGVVVRDIYEDKLNRIWIATESGLYWYNPQNNRISQFSNAQLHKPIYYIYEDSQNVIWLGTFDGGLFSLSREESLKANTEDARLNHYLHQPNKPTSIKSNRVWYIYEDSEENLFFATSISLDKFDRDKEEFIHYNTNSATSPNAVQYQLNTIYESSKGTLWLGTSGGGLASFNRETETISYYNTPKVIYGIIEDDNSNLWLSTSVNGICKYNPKTDQYKTFSSPDGIQGNMFERNAFSKLPSGKLVFGGSNGVDIFHPDSLIESEYTPPIVLTDFKLFNKSVSQMPKTDNRFKAHISELKRVELSYKENVFSIEFSALDYLSPEKNNYAYKLEGFNNNWIYTDSENRTATYTNLDGGKYIFKVNLYNNNILLNENGLELEIVVLPPYWKTWWFKVFASIAIVLILLIIIRRRLKSYETQKLELQKQVKLKTSELQKQKETLENANFELQKQKTEIISQRDSLKEMADKVEEANIRKLKFFTNISHELRTPLTLIISPIGRIIKLKKLNTEIKNDLEIINRNALRLQRLVNQLMDFRKIETGTMPLVISDNDIVHFIKSIKESFNGIAKQYNVRYTFNSNTSNIKCWFDGDKIEKIVYNLLSNAFKYTKVGGKIELNINYCQSLNSTENLHKSLTKNNIIPVGDAIEIEVRDTGKGIAKDKLDQIFDRFYQIENADSTLQESTGIGLAMTKNLVEMHMGIIMVTSELNVGSTFKVQLPVSKLFFIQNNLEEALKEGSNIPKHKTSIIEEDYKELNENIITQKYILDAELPKILIVEDNSDLRAFLNSCFNTNYNVILAKNGKEGIEKAIEFQPSLILSDVMMPIMDGIKMCSNIKSNIETSHIPVILLTARSLLEHQLEGLETGADDYITKPFESDILQLKVKNIIDTRLKLSKSFSNTVESNINDSSLSKVDKEFLNNAIDIIHKHISEVDFDVAAFVKEMGMGRTLFYKKIKNLTNQSVNEFIQTVRLKKAINLMMESNLRVSEVCYDTGFSSPRYFSTCFKKQFGTTPTEYLNKLTKD